MQEIDAIGVGQSETLRRDCEYRGAENDER